MNPESSTGRRSVLLFIVGLVVLATGPGMAVAQDASTAPAFTGLTGTIVIQEGQTVDQISGIAGSIIVHGTVTGNINGLAGDVVISETGTVQGDVSVATGSLRIAGTVGGSVSAGSGNVVVTETGTVGGDFSVGAGNVIIDGSIAGDATVGGDTITLGESAAIAGGLRYDGTLRGDTSVVQGPVTLDENLGNGFNADRWTTGVLRFPGWADTVYGFVANLILGAVLLLLFPSFSRHVADRVASTPARSGAFGFVGLIGVPIALVMIAITIIGIPLAILGLFVYLFSLWVGVVYGEYAVGHWLLGRSSAEVNRWYALVIGLAVFAVLGFVPFIGGLFTFGALIVGLGALGSALRGEYRRRRGGEPTPTDAPTGSEASTA